MDRLPFLAIAHKAGNSLEALRRAVACKGINAIECDVHYNDEARLGYLVVRHEQRFGPLSFDKICPNGERPSRFRDNLLCHRAWATPSKPEIALGTILPHAGKCFLLLDLKSPSAKARKNLCDVVPEFIQQNELAERTLLVSGDWPLLDSVRKEHPELRAFYSIGDERGLASFFARYETERTICGVSLPYYMFLRPDAAHILTRLRNKGFAVIAWTVNDQQRYIFYGTKNPSPYSPPECSVTVETIAQHLKRMGVSGIVSDSLEILEKMAR